MLDPEVVIRFENSKHGFNGVLVLNSTLLGPGSGGVRILPDVNEAEVKLLAEAMTRKNAFFNIPAGGAKTGIAFDPQTGARAGVIADFAAAVSDLIRELRYVPSPDMGSTESDIVAIYRRLGSESLLRNSILTKTVNGIPLARLSTAEGVVEAVMTSIRITRNRIENLSVAIEGFGRLGALIGAMLVERGLKISAISNEKQALFQKGGIDIGLVSGSEQQRGLSALEEYAKTTPVAEIRDRSAILDEPVDILIPSARPLLVTKSNADKVQAKLIVPCANAPVSESVERPLAERGVLVVPDFVSNAGGVLGGFLCRLNVSTDALRSVVREKIGDGVSAVLKNSNDLTPGDLARHVVDERLESARRHPYEARFRLLWHWKKFLSRPGGISAASWYARRHLGLKWYQSFALR
jgi:glutamate dehydrogenase/leucine dehydrogenase